MDVFNIVKEYLLANKYDGLYDEDECGCELDNLFLCDDDNEPSACKPGYKKSCDCGEHDFHISEDKEG